MPELTDRNETGGIAVAAKKPQLRRVVAAACAVFLIAALLVGAVSYAVDPLNLCHPDRDVEQARAALSIMQAGSGVANMDNYNERLLKRMAVRTIPKKNTVALGSSRAALITAEMAGEEDFFNYSVTGASLADVAALYLLLSEAGKTPERVILSLDPWMLNDNYMTNNPGRHDGLYDVFERFTAKYPELSGLPDLPDTQEKYTAEEYRATGARPLWETDAATAREIFSIPYFQDSLEYVFGRGEPAATGEMQGLTGILHADGSFAYPQSFREASAEVVDGRAREWLPESVLGCEDYASSGRLYEKVLDIFLSLAREDGVEIVFLLTPLHPIIYSYMCENSRYARAVASEELFREAARKYGITVTGSFDPNALGYESADFYDAAHLCSARVAELLSAVNG